MIDYGRSYSAKWRVFRVNPDTWADGELIKQVDTVSVSRDVTSVLLESGTMEVTGELEQAYYRIVMTAEQDSGAERVDVATLLFNVDDGNLNHGTSKSKADGLSVLYPASTTSITTGEYAPAGVDGAQYVGDLLEQAINAPVEVEGSFKLNDHIVHELGSSVIEAVWAVLDAGRFVLQIDGRGVVHVRPRPEEPSLVISDESVQLMSYGVDYSTNEAEIPNRYIVISDNMLTVASNDDPTSRVSTVSRGYFVDLVDTSPTPVNGETMNKYATERLKDASILKDTRSFIREYAPNVYPFSIVKSSIPEMKGDFRVESQSITCNAGITVNEKASMEIKLWE